METNVYYDRVDFQCLDQIEHQTNDLYLTRCGIHQPSPGYVWGPKSVRSTICILFWREADILKSTIRSII